MIAESVFCCLCVDMTFIQRASGFQKLYDLEIGPTDTPAHRKPTPRLALAHCLLSIACVLQLHESAAGHIVPVVLGMPVLLQGC